MSCVKQTISAANPCRICGKPDYCYRLVFDTNETLHCCARVSEKAVTSSYGTFIWKKSKDTSIGVYNYYQEVQVHYLKTHLKKVLPLFFLSFPSQQH